jgi:hypothetical protein
VQPINPVLARALAGRPPRSLAEAASLYASLLEDVERIWQDAERRAALDGRTPGPLPVPALESLRQVFHGLDSPPNIVMLDYGDLGLLPDRPSQAKLQELRNAVQKWLTIGPGAPARALSVEDTPISVECRVFVRGNPNNLGEPAPRRFLAALVNHPFAIDAARGILVRPEIAAEHNANAKVGRLYRLIYNRPPGNEDLSLAREFLSEPGAQPDRWQSFAQSLLMANEFVFVD